METRFVEATQGIVDGFNWGKFLVGRFDADEWNRRSSMLAELGRSSSVPLLTSQGWSRGHVFVFDLATGEGAMFAPGGSPVADLNKHRIWVCPMFEPFLVWLYGHIESYSNSRPAAGWFGQLPSLVELPGVAGAMAGYRRQGP